jgi:hypothetical protein
MDLTSSQPTLIFFFKDSKDDAIGTNYMKAKPLEKYAWFTIEELKPRRLLFSVASLLGTSLVHIIYWQYI